MTRFKVVRCCLAVCFACSFLFSVGSPSLADETGAEPKDGDKTAAVGIKKVSDWGYNAEDATEFLQAALDSGERRILIDRQSGPWMIRPVSLRSDQEIVFEEGVEIVAKRGAFLGKGDSLFRGDNVENLILRAEGKGATLRMWKSDYHEPPYEKAEWRHALCLKSCKNILVENLSFVSSGGDGIYLGVATKGVPCCNVTIRNVVCDDNNRQGISVISARELLIEDTLLRNTSGTAPAAGIDFEPNAESEELVHCVMRNCISENNDGGGYLFALHQQSDASAPISITLESCISRNNTGRGLNLYTNAENGPPKGTLHFNGLRLENDGVPALHRDSCENSLKLTFERSSMTLGQETTDLDSAWLEKVAPRINPANLPIVLPDVTRLKLIRGAQQNDETGDIFVRSLLGILAYAEQGQEVELAIQQHRVGGYEVDESTIAVVSPSGHEEKFSLIPSFNEPTVIQFVAKESGCYKLTTRIPRNACQIKSANVPWCYCGKKISLYRPQSVLYFRVPEGTARFDLTVMGSQGEAISAEICDANGKSVWTAENISTLAAFVSGDSPEPGVWSVALKKPSEGSFEDCAVALFGIPAILFERPDSSWSE
ncbi:MAG: right-handed parallel beta-helix repeat-containing protein [Planctomycetia bacterium]|nr:right-handed parallel beta-helix repeat-containing protein [Planctomycetia bacterium]